jgi:hypothetical protein
MSIDSTQPTTDPDVNALLHVLLANVQTVLEHHFIGLYVHGSVASGDFNPHSSDIDFVVVTADELPGELLPTIAAMHASITASGLKYAPKLEGSYIPRQALRRYDPRHAQHPALRVDGSFDVDGHGSDWVIQCHILREKGVVVAGPALHTLIDPVQPNHVRRAGLATLWEWWSPQIHDPFRLHSREYQAYAVLTMCRALYTLQYGTVTSKPVAARWAQAALDERWGALIERALTWDHDDGVDDLNETLDFIRYTLASAQQFVLAADEV